MAETGASRIDIVELASLLQVLEPGVILLPPRLVRRVIKQERRVVGLGLQVPHRRSYVIGRDRILEILDIDDLGLPPVRELPSALILLAAPDPGALASTPREAVLLKYWRRLFHARVHLAIENRFSERGVTKLGIGERIWRIGQAEFEEIRNVLRQDEYLLPPEDNRTVYIEFAALYLELRYFAGTLLPHYFPALGRLDRIDALLAGDLDAAALFAATRPKGAPDPIFPEEDADDESEPEPAAEEMPAACAPSFERFRKLIRRAKKAGKRGNLVRAVLMRTQAARVAPPERRYGAQADRRAEVDRLAERLRAALGLDNRDTDRWRRALTSLLEPAVRGIWPVEARLLYDLQKVCVDHERSLYAIDLVEWVLFLGQRPLKLPLPCQRETLLLKHLRSAARRLKTARLGENDRQRLATLLQAAIHEREERLRNRLRPLIRGALEDVGMRPRNLPEHVAQNKLVEELLDRINERGYLSMGDLRDEISRNNLKLPDVAGPRELWLGDRLLLADPRLARVLDGVYRRGEFYLRWLQCLSSLAFGTRAGRFLTRYVALPFGGAFIALEALQHVLNLVARAFTGARIHLVNSVSVAVLGIFFLGLLYHEGFRRRVLQILGVLYAAGRGLLVDLPAFILRQPLVRRLLDSRPFVFFRRRIFKPLVVASLAGVALGASGIPKAPSAVASAAIFLAVSLFLNSRLGRDVEEAVADGMVRLWRHLNVDLLPGLFRVVMGFFKQLVEAADRFLYTVDEWLRFRSGDGRVLMVVKPILGLFWFYVSYAARFCINLLIEPQVNPIKHFPVVTISHKLVLGLFVPPFAQVLALTMDRALAGTVAVTVGSMIPGIFGFLVWELKENWRLYQANQAPTLRPVIIGHHGETMLRFLKPGFHSGTLPKLYAKLRRAERAALRTGNWTTVRKHRLALRHVEESIRHFIERELVFLLNQSKQWGGLRLAAGTITLATNRVRIELQCSELAGAGMAVEFEEHAGGLQAGVAEPGWLPHVTRRQSRALGTALLGLLKMADVERIGEQLQACFASSSVSGVIMDDALVVRNRSGAEAVHELRDGQGFEPQALGGSSPGYVQRLPAAHLVFSNVSPSWQHWVQIWERDQQGKELSDH